tara:strand:+ start:391 stop:570 length:180 start_codon:yes stop_codon:yes gene_type:complete
MEIKNAKYNKDSYGDSENVSINAVIDGKVWSVPLDPANMHYAEIMRQVDAGDLTIEEAD